LPIGFQVESLRKSRESVEISKVNGFGLEASLQGFHGSRWRGTAKDTAGSFTWDFSAPLS
jgi:hypothetical protein